MDSYGSYTTSSLAKLPRIVHTKSINKKTSIALILKKLRSAQCKEFVNMTYLVIETMNLTENAHRNVCNNVL